MDKSTQEADAQYYSQPLSPPSEFLSSCPKFRILVLGNPESTKQEIFSKVFGVDLDKKLLASAYSPSHNLTEPLDLLNQNEHLEVLTSLNFGTGNQQAYDSVVSFLESSIQNNNNEPHCIWYCVSAQESRTVHPLEVQFFKKLSTLAPHTPVVLVFTKYDEFVSQVRLDWSKDAEERGLSKVAVTHILRDLATKRFEHSIGERWDEALQLGVHHSSSWQEHNVRRVCVAGSEGLGDDDTEPESFLHLVGITLAGLKERDVKLAFAVAQRNSAFIDTHFCAGLASTYFTVDTGHARKLPGIDIRDMLPNFFVKCIQIFNMRDVSSVLTDPSLPVRILKAAFHQTDQFPLLTEILQHSSTESSSLLVNNLSPHERAVLLVQGFTLLVLFLHRLADAQWPHRENFSLSLPPLTVTSQGVDRLVKELENGHERISVLEMVEGSTIFTECAIRQGIADLIAGVIERVEQEEKGDANMLARESEFYSFVGGSTGVGAGRYVYEGIVGGVGNHPGGPRGQRRSVVVVDDSDLQEISLSFVNDKSPDDVVLPCGLRILPLN